MALNYRLYQIGRELDNPSNISILTAKTDLSSPLDRVDSDGNDYWEATVDDISTLPPSRVGFYALIGDEIMRCHIDIGRTELRITDRGMFGTKINPHNAGDTVYQFDLNSDPSAGLLDKVVVLDEIDNFYVEDISEVEDVIEREKGQFRISNVDATVTDIGRHRMNEVGDIQTPWVFEVYDGDVKAANLLFQGFIREDAKYNASTQKISFSAVSWLDILNKVSAAPARFIYETPVLKLEVEDEANVGDGPVKVFVPNEGVGDQGDTLAIDTDAGEIREQIIVQNTTNDGDLREFWIRPEARTETEVRYNSKGDTNNKISRKEFEAHSRAGGVVAVSYSVNNGTAENRLEDIAGEEGWYVQTYDSDDDPVQKIKIDKKSVTNNFRTSIEWPETFLYKEILGTPQANGAILKTHSYYKIKRGGFEERLRRKIEDAQQDSKVEIIGKEAWGYPGESIFGVIPTGYKPTNLLDALLTVNDESAGQPLLGILPEIYGDATKSDTLLDEDLDPRVEFPEKPIDAVRMIQQSSASLLKETPTTQQNANNKTIPKVDYEFKPRIAFDDDTATAYEDVISFKEDLGRTEVDAVVVETNEQYSGGGDQPEVAGWYYDSVEDDEVGQPGDTDYRPAFTTKPDGENVITIDTNIYPSHEGVVYTGGDSPIRRDERLSSLAKFYYNHFNKANREVQLELGVNDVDVLGEFIDLDEGPIVDDQVLVTKKTTQLEKNHLETSLTGRVGQTEFPVEDQIEVIIDGAESYRANSNDEVEITLTALNSWATGPGRLEYSWRYKQKGGTFTEVGGSTDPDGPIFDETFTVTSYTQYVIEVTVERVENGTVQNSATGSVTVSAEPFKGVRENFYSNEVSYDKTQLTSGGTRYGQIQIVPQKITNIQQDNNGNYLVEYISAKGGEIEVDPTNDSNWTRVGGTDQSNTNSRVSTVNGNPSAFEVDVELDEKHVSNILTRIRWREQTGFDNQRRGWAFDFDRIADIQNVDAFVDGSNNLRYNALVDEDTESFDVEVSLNGGSYNTKDTIDTISQKAFSDKDTTVDLSVGDYATVRLSPYDDTGGAGGSGELGRQQSDSVALSSGTTNDEPEILNISAYTDGNTDDLKFDVFVNDKTVQFDWAVDKGDTGANDETGTFTSISPPETVTVNPSTALAEGERVRIKVTPQNGSGSNGGTTEILFVRAIDADQVAEVSHLNAFWDESQQEIGYNVSFDDDVAEYSWTIDVNGSQAGSSNGDISISNTPAADSTVTGVNAVPGDVATVKITPKNPSQNGPTVEDKIRIGVDADTDPEITNLSAYKDGDFVGFDIGLDDDVKSWEWYILEDGSPFDGSASSPNTESDSGPTHVTRASSSQFTRDNTYTVYATAYDQSGQSGQASAEATAKFRPEADDVAEVTNVNVYYNRSANIIEFNAGFDKDVDSYKYEVFINGTGQGQSSSQSVSGPATVNGITTNSSASLGDEVAIEIEPFSGGTPGDIARDEIHVGVDSDQVAEVLNINLYELNNSLQLDVGLDDDVDSYDWFIDDLGGAGSWSGTRPSGDIGSTPTVDSFDTNISVDPTTFYRVIIEPFGTVNGSNATATFKLGVDDDQKAEILFLNAHTTGAPGNLAFDIGFDNDTESFDWFVYESRSESNLLNSNSETGLSGPSTIDNIDTQVSATLGESYVIKVEPNGPIDGDAAYTEIKVAVDADDTPEMVTVDPFVDGNGVINFDWVTDDDVAGFVYNVDSGTNLTVTSPTEGSPSTGTPVDTGVPINFGQKKTVNVTPYDSNNNAGPTTSVDIEIGIQENRDQFSVQKWQDSSPPDGGVKEGVLDILPDDNINTPISDVHYRKKVGGELAKAGKDIVNYNQNANFLTKGANEAYRMRVDLDPKHSSVIEYYVEFQDSEDVVGIATFDIDETPEFRNVSAYTEPDQNNDQGILKVNADIDEDTDKFDIFVNGNITDGSPYTSSLDGKALSVSGVTVGVGNGSQVTVEFVPKKSNGDIGVKEKVETFYNQSGWIKKTDKLFNTLGSSPSIDIAVGNLFTDTDMVGIETTTGASNGSKVTRFGTDGSKQELLMTNSFNQSGGTFISIGDGKDLTDFGISIKQQGNEVFKVDDSGTTNIGNLDVANDIKVQGGNILAGEDSGTFRVQITNSDGIDIITDDAANNPQGHRVEWYDNSSNLLAYVSADGQYDGTNNQSDGTLQFLGGFNILMNLDGRTGSFSINQDGSGNVEARAQVRNFDFQGPGGQSGIEFVLYTPDVPGDRAPHINVREAPTTPVDPPSGYGMIWVETDSNGDTQLWFKSDNGNFDRISNA